MLGPNQLNWEDMMTVISSLVFKWHREKGTEELSADVQSQLLNRLWAIFYSAGRINRHFHCTSIDCFGALSLGKRHFGGLLCSARRCQAGQQVRNYSDFWMLSWLKRDWVGKNVCIQMSQWRWPAEKVQLLRGLNQSVDYGYSLYAKPASTRFRRHGTRSSLCFEHSCDCSMGEASPFLGVLQHP